MAAVSSKLLEGTSTKNYEGRCGEQRAKNGHRYSLDHDFGSCMLFDNPRDSKFENIVRKDLNNGSVKELLYGRKPAIVQRRVVVSRTASCPLDSNFFFFFSFLPALFLFKYA